MSDETKRDRAAIDALASAFLGLFSNRHGLRPELERIHDLFIPQGMIIKNTDRTPEIYTLASFIQPRQLILTDGTLTEFEESEEWARTILFGHIAQRTAIYRKSGRLRGEWFSARGLKLTHFIQTPQGWKMSAVIWDDEREGLALPSAASHPAPTGGWVAWESGTSPLES